MPKLGASVVWAFCCVGKPRRKGKMGENREIPTPF